MPQIDAQSEEDESLEYDDHRAHVEYDDHIGHMWKYARTSFRGYENVLHRCRLGVYRLERTKKDKYQPPYLKFELFIWFTRGNHKQ